MNSGVRPVLTITAATALLIAVLSTSACSWVEGPYSGARKRLEAQAAAFCEPIEIGSDIAQVESLRRGRRFPDGTGSGGERYHYVFWGGVYQAAECRVTVDSQGKVIAKRSGALGAFPPDSARGASAPASG